jgi:hypothetical protein
MEKKEPFGAFSLTSCYATRRGIYFFIIF